MISIRMNEENDAASDRICDQCGELMMVLGTLAGNWASPAAERIRGALRLGGPGSRDQEVLSTRQ
jgi:hypothetical protein